MKPPPTPEILVPALRQYRHNSPEPHPDFVVGLDYQLTCSVVRNLQGELKQFQEIYSKQVDLISNLLKQRNDLHQQLKQYTGEQP